VRPQPVADKLRLMACLADLKEIDYRNTLAIASLIEVLVEHGLLDPAELARKADELHRDPAPAAWHGIRRTGSALRLVRRQQASGSR
jgi:hypothetical protein